MSSKPAGEPATAKGKLDAPVAFPEELEGSTIELEGHRMEVVEAGFTDTSDTTALWVPDLRLMIAGDVAYNDTHQYTAETTGESREHWAWAADKLAAYDPVAVVAGHKKPNGPDDPAILAETAAYLRDASRTPEELYDRMLDLYPRRATRAPSGAAPSPQVSVASRMMGPAGRVVRDGRSNDKSNAMNQ